MNGICSFFRWRRNMDAKRWLSPLRERCPRCSWHWRRRLLKKLLQGIFLFIFVRKKDWCCITFLFPGVMWIFQLCVCVCVWAVSIKQILFAVYFILFPLPFHFSPLFTLILSSSLIYLHFFPLCSWLFYYGCCHASTNLISSFMLLKNPISLSRCVLFILKQQLYYILCMSHWFLRQVAMICPQLTAKWTKKSLSRRWRKHPRLRVCLQCPRKFPFPQQV